MSKIKTQPFVCSKFKQENKDNNEIIEQTNPINHIKKRNQQVIINNNMIDRGLKKHFNSVKVSTYSHDKLININQKPVNINQNNVFDKHKENNIEHTKFDNKKLKIHQIHFSDSSSVVSPSDNSRANSRHNSRNNSRHNSIINNKNSNNARNNSVTKNNHRNDKTYSIIDKFVDSNINSSNDKKSNDKSNNNYIITHVTTDNQNNNPNTKSQKNSNSKIPNKLSNSTTTNNNLNNTHNNSNNNINSNINSNFNSVNTSKNHSRTSSQEYEPINTNNDCIINRRLDTIGEQEDDGFMTLRQGNNFTNKNSNNPIIPIKKNTPSFLLNSCSSRKKMPKVVNNENNDIHMNVPFNIPVNIPIKNSVSDIIQDNLFYIGSDNDYNVENTKSIGNDNNKERIFSFVSNNNNNTNSPYNNNTNNIFPNKNTSISSNKNKLVLKVNVNKLSNMATESINKKIQNIRKKSIEEKPNVYNNTHHNHNNMNNKNNTYNNKNDLSDDTKEFIGEELNLQFNSDYFNDKYNKYNNDTDNDNYSEKYINISNREKSEESSGILITDSGDEEENLDLINTNPNINKNNIVNIHSNFDNIIKNKDTKDTHDTNSINHHHKLKKDRYSHNAHNTHNTHNPYKTRNKNKFSSNSTNNQIKIIESSGFNIISHECCSESSFSKDNNLLKKRTLEFLMDNFLCLKSKLILNNQLDVLFNHNQLYCTYKAAKYPKISNKLKYLTSFMIEEILNKNISVDVIEIYLVLFNTYQDYVVNNQNDSLKMHFFDVNFMKKISNQNKVNFEEINKEYNIIEKLNTYDILVFPILNYTNKIEFKFYLAKLDLKIKKITYYDPSDYLSVSDHSFTVATNYKIILEQMMYYYDNEHRLIHNLKTLSFDFDSTSAVLEEDTHLMTMCLIEKIYFNGNFKKNKQFNQLVDNLDEKKEEIFLRVSEVYLIMH